MIQLQKFGPEDFDQLISWASTPEILMQFAGPDFRFPLTREQLELSFSSPGRLSFTVIDMPGEVAIGHAEVIIKNENAHLCRILIGDENLRGKGRGQMIVHELLDLSFNELRCKQASLYVYDWNKPAIQCYTRAGFTTVEREKNISEIHGNKWTALKMVISMSKWNSVRTVAD